MFGRKSDDYKRYISYGKYYRSLPNEIEVVALGSTHETKY